MLDINYEIMLETKNRYPDNVNFLLSNRHNIEICLKESDVIINCLLWPKNRKDHLIYEEDLKNMKKNAMIIDVSCDDAGAIETCHSTSHDNPIYFVDEILHYCVDNIPSAFAHTASVTLSNATIPFALAIADKGVRQAIKDDKHLRRGLTTYDGKLTLLETARKFQINFNSPDDIVKIFNTKGGTK